MKRSVIPRPTETAALANLAPRPEPALENLYTDLATTRRRRDLEGFGLIGHLIVRAALRKVGEQ